MEMDQNVPETPLWSYELGTDDEWTNEKGNIS